MHQLSPDYVYNHRTEMDVVFFHGLQFCRNPTLGLSVRMQLTLLKVGKWSLLGLPKTQKTIWRVKSPCIGAFFISMERSWSLDAQNGLAWAIWTSAAQVMGKRRAGSQTTSPLLVVWLPTTKSQESTFSRCHLKECNTALESSQWELQLWFKPRPDSSLGRRIMSVQSPGTPTRTVSRLQLGSPRKKSHSDVASAVRRREYYMGEGGGFPSIRAVVSFMCQSARGLSQHPRVFPNAN